MLFLVVALLFPLQTTPAQDAGKEAMDHTIYEGWNNLERPLISNNGQWVSYEADPARGDGHLVLYRTGQGKRSSFERGCDAVFAPTSAFLAFRIKPPDSLTREAGRNKIKKEEMPVDSLGIVLTSDTSLLLYSRVRSFRLPEDDGDWMAFLHEPESDSLHNNHGHKRIETGQLYILHPSGGEMQSFDDVSEYRISGNGNLVGFISASGDSASIVTVGTYNTGTGQTRILFEDRGTACRLALSETGDRLAFLYHRDTAKIVGYDLYGWSVRSGEARLLLDSLSEGLPSGWGISKYGNLWFSKDASRLFFGTAPIPPEQREDSLDDEDKPKLDIWNWNDGLLQTMQKIGLKSEQQRTYLAEYSFGQERMHQLGDETVEEVHTAWKGTGDYAIGFDYTPYEKLVSWKSGRYRDVYLVSLSDGEKTRLLSAKKGPVMLSPASRYVLWYEQADSNWYVHDIGRDELSCITCGTDVPYYSETFDKPGEPNPYGVAGWTRDDESVLIYDRYDTWKFDPSGNSLPLNLTNGNGRKEHIVYRYRRLSDDIGWIPSDEPLFLEGLDEDDKQTGFYTASLFLTTDPEELIAGPYSFESPVRQKDGKILLYRRGSFTDYPDLWITDMDFRDPKQVSRVNPQAGRYFWGKPELVHWTSLNGDSLDGILYVPEQMDPGKKIPMIVYFYERSSSGMYRHRIPSPSRSTINIPWCVSNGYAVFVPDIVYRVGYPGQSAFDAVVSGTLAMLREHEFIDAGHVGVQGQSWGGYQVAYLVTRTDIFKAAMAGAPVSNMTSAYGGIRWGTGMSRMFQYEETQSRIGGSLWERPDLYLENSPLFRADRINTPLLIMHNDHDGAVPWYQGIELFTALRRLEKPAWMLVYNGENHNLNNWADRKDLSIRMMQFFDHYLKGSPAPDWMTRGIPATRKGKDLGYGFSNEGE